MRENYVKITLLRNVNKEIYVLTDEATKIAGKTNSDQKIMFFFSIVTEHNGKM